MTWLTRIALKKRWLTLLVTVAVTGASVWAMLTLKMELFPDIELPITTVVTVYPQAQPEELVEQVTAPIEDAIAGMAGLRHITSTSLPGRSIIFLQFRYGTDMAGANAEIADRLGALTLPPEVRAAASSVPGLDENPSILPIDLNIMPVVILSLHGDVPTETLRQTAADTVVSRLQQVDGVFSVEVEGGTGEKVLVTPDPVSMAEHHVSVGQIAASLPAQQLGSLEAVRQAVVSPQGLILGQVAGVELGTPRGASISRTNGRPSVNITVTKEADANTVTTANGVVDAAMDIRGGLPQGLQIATILDQSEYIEASVSDLTNNALLGSGLAVIVFFLFLAAFRTSLVTAVSIPLSLLVAFLAMSATSVTINILTLGAMVIAVGRVIDNSIVILEVMFRRMQEGEPFRQAAVKGVREVVVPITSATAATIVIFTPLIFVGGIVGEMFIPFGLTVTYALLGSLLIALTVVPALAGQISHAVSRKPDDSWYLRGYSAALEWCLHHRAVTILAAAALFFGSFSALPVVGTTFLPEMDTSFLTVEIDLPEGASMETTIDVVLAAEAVLGAHQEVTAYNTVAGSGNGAASMRQPAAGAADVTIRALTEPGTDAARLADELESQMADIHSAGISVSALSALSGGLAQSLEISVRGNSYEDVRKTSEALMERLMSGGQAEGAPASSPVEGMEETRRRYLEQLTGIATDLPRPEPRLIIDPDPASALALGFTSAQLEQLRQELFIIQSGATVARATIGGAPREVFIQGIANHLPGAAAARQLPVGYPQPVTLGEIASVAVDHQLPGISRQDRKLSATISAEVKGDNVGAVSRAVEAEMEAMRVPEGVEMSTGGTAEDMRDSFSAMFIAIPVAMALAYLVLVVTYRSFRNPLIIMVSLPLASLGAMVGLLIAGRPLGVSGMMGVLMLVGIVLTNAVVLIAVVEQLRRDGVTPGRALVEGARTRLRPILMTALTTMIAMLPLALGLGEGVLMAAELATVVIGGLFSSTALTLLVLPVVYAAANRIPRDAPTPESAGPADAGVKPV